MEKYIRHCEIATAIVAIQEIPHVKMDCHAALHARNDRWRRIDCPLREFTMTRIYGYNNVSTLVLYAIIDYTNL